MKEITAHELKKLKDEKAKFFLLDVRNQDEYDVCNLGGQLIPLSELPKRLNELDPDQKIVVHCKMGGRSSQAVQFLEQNGFREVYNLSGGLMAWINEIDPKMPKY